MGPRCTVTKFVPLLRAVLSKREHVPVAVRVVPAAEALLHPVCPSPFVLATVRVRHLPHPATRHLPQRGTVQAGAGLLAAMPSLGDLLRTLGRLCGSHLKRRQVTSVPCSPPLQTRPPGAEHRHDRKYPMRHQQPYTSCRASASVLRSAYRGSRHSLETILGTLLSSR